MRAQLLQQRTTNYVPIQQDSKAANKKGCTTYSKFPTHLSAWFVKLHDVSVKSKATISQCVQISHKLGKNTNTHCQRGTLPGHNRDNIYKDNQINQWMVELLLNEKPVQFKIDAGANITAVNPSMVQPSKHKLIKCGQFIGMLTYQQSNTCQQIFVVINQDKLHCGHQVSVSVDKKHLMNMDGTTKLSLEELKVATDLFY